MPDHTPHQRKIIERYYDQRDEIMLVKLQEIVTDLALSDRKPQRDQLWKRAEKAMRQLKIPPRILQSILDKRSEELLARYLRDWLARPKQDARQHGV